MKTIMKNAFVFLFGMGYFWAIGIFANANFSETDFLTGLLAAILLCSGTIVVIGTIIVFLEEAWKKG